MSREEFKNFVNCVEHNIRVKKKLSKCKGRKELILLAKNHGYSVTIKDLEEDKTCTNFDFWFKESRIKPLKYTK